MKTDISEEEYEKIIFNLMKYYKEFANFKEFKICNTNSILTNEQILDCINLINPAYSKLKIHIKFYNSKLSYYLNSLFNINFITFLDALKMRAEQCMGFYAPGKKTIYIFAFSLKRGDAKTDAFRFITCLYHELRHAYQDQYMHKKFIKDYDDESYFSNWTEKDAMKFMMRMVSKHFIELCKIAGIPNPENIKIGFKTI